MPMTDCVSAAAPVKCSAAEMVSVRKFLSTHLITFRTNRLRQMSLNILKTMEKDKWVCGVKPVGKPVLFVVHSGTNYLLDVCSGMINQLSHHFFLHPDHYNDTVISAFLNVTESHYYLVCQYALVFKGMDLTRKSFREQYESLFGLKCNSCRENWILVIQTVHLVKHIRGILNTQFPFTNSGLLFYNLNEPSTWERNILCWDRPTEIYVYFNAKPSLSPQCPPLGGNSTNGVVSQQQNADMLLANCKKPTFSYQVQREFMGNVVSAFVFDGQWIVKDISDMPVTTPAEFKMIQQIIKEDFTLERLVNELTNC